MAQRVPLKVESDEAALPAELEELIAEDTEERSRPRSLADSPVYYSAGCGCFDVGCVDRSALCRV